MWKKILEFFAHSVPDEFLIRNDSHLQELFLNSKVKELMHCRDVFVEKNPDRVYLSSIVAFSECFGLLTTEFNYVTNKEYSNYSSFIRVVDNQPYIFVDKSLHVIEQRIEIAYQVVSYLLNKDEVLKEDILYFMLTRSNKDMNDPIMAIALELLAPYWLTVRKTEEFGKNSYYALERFFGIPEIYLKLQLKYGVTV